MSSFEDRLKQVPANLRGPIVDVADTMELCLRWFQFFSIEPTPDALVAMAALILGREER